MADAGDNGDGTGTQEVEVEVEEVVAVLPDRTLFDDFFKSVITRARGLVGQTDKDSKAELYKLGALIAKLANYSYPKLATIHQVNDDMDSFIERMKREFDPEDAQRALNTHKRRTRRLREKSHAGRPKLAEGKDD